MKSIILTPDSEKDFEFLRELLGKLGYDSYILYDEEKEDLALLKAMVKEKKGDYVSEDEILKALSKK